jgi:hypothetical protein
MFSNDYSFNFTVVQMLARVSMMHYPNWMKSNSSTSHQIRPLLH